MFGLFFSVLKIVFVLNKRKRYIHKVKNPKSPQPATESRCKKYLIAAMAQPRFSRSRPRHYNNADKGRSGGIYFMDIAPASLLTKTAKEAKEEKTRGLQTRK